MKLSRNRPLVLFVLGLASMAGLGSLHFLGGGPMARERLVILTPHGDNIRQEIGAAFQAWHAVRFGTRPDLEWVDQGGTSEGLRYVQARFARTPASIGVDVFFGGGTPPFRTLAKAGFLVPHPLPLPPGLPVALAGIRLQAPEEGWYGIALSSFGILSNLPLARAQSLPEPRSWADLADPRAFGWVACVDPRGSGSAHVIYEIVLQKFGWEKGFSLLTRIAANARTFTKGASGVLPLISTGEAALTVAIDQYAWSLIGTEGPGRIGFVLPEGETVVTPDPAAILKGAPNLETARRFLAFLISVEGQKLWVLKPGVPGGPARLSLSRLAVRPEVYADLDSAGRAVGENPFAPVDSSHLDVNAPPFVYSDSLTESRWALVSDLLGLWMVDSHQAAAAAWDPLRRRLLGAALQDHRAWESELLALPYFRPPGSWDEMQPMAEKWQDPEYRNAAMARWARDLAGGSRRSAGGSRRSAGGPAEGSRPAKETR